ncbi:hypothetical protein RJT34_05432 [Clitoria ternatea]|uniref:Uncharacterized protein n=1 Tax=Clitoria ternatea TaxID=43366 RepID=A0AAN9PSL0_CLITE
MPSKRHIWWSANECFVIGREQCNLPVAEAKNRDSWIYFSGLLEEAISNGGEGRNLVLMTKRQKLLFWKAVRSYTVEFKCMMRDIREVNLYSSWMIEQHCKGAMG